MAASSWRNISRHRDHSWAKTRYSGYVDGELPGRQARRLTQHQQLCPECRHVVRTLRALLPSLRMLRKADATEASLADSIVESVRADRD
jgi:anti-sigma factor RsiW